MRMGKRTVFISDTHIGNKNFEPRKYMFYDFLGRGIDEDVDDLYSLGDGFELLQSNWDAIKQDKRLVNRLNETGEKTRFHIIVGNHDIGLSGIEDFGTVFPHLMLHAPEKKRIILRERVGKETTPKRAVQTLTSGKLIHPYGKDVYISHGWVYDHYFSKDTRRFDDLIRVAGYVDGQKFLDLLDSARGILGVDPEMRGNRRELLLGARDVAEYKVCGKGVGKRKPHLDYVILGHTHWQTKKKLYDEVKEKRKPLKTFYVNTGCWLETDRYRGSDFTVLHEDGTIKNYKWEKMTA